jgi:hypothetical protein
MGIRRAVLLNGLFVLASLVFSVPIAKAQNVTPRITQPVDESKLTALEKSSGQQHVKDRVHFWPFDGWSVPPNRSVVAEVYPALWSRTFPSAGRTSHQQDAFAIAEWLRRANCDGSLKKFLYPELEPGERKTAQVTGGILCSSLRKISVFLRPPWPAGVPQGGANIAALV